MEKAYGDQAILLSRLEKVIHHFCSASHKSAVVPMMTMITGRTSFHNRKFECNDYTRSELKSLRIVYLASLAQSNIMEGKLLTKRDVYYMERGLFPNPQAVDRALTALSEIVQAPRNDLNIVAAPKGLVAGSIAFTDEDGHSVNVSLFGADGCLIPCRPERMQEVHSNAHAVVLCVCADIFTIE